MDSGILGMVERWRCFFFFFLKQYVRSYVLKFVAFCNICDYNVNRFLRDSILWSDKWWLIRQCYL